MATVTLSADNAVILPPEVLRELQLSSGEELQVFLRKGSVELVPLRPVQELRGFVRGMDTSIERG